MKHHLNSAVRTNFIEKTSYVAHRLPQMNVVTDNNFISVDCGLPSDTFNIIVARNLLSPTQLWQEAVEPFMRKQFPLALWYWEDEGDRHNLAVLKRFGLLHSETQVAMAADLAQLHIHPSLPAGLTIQSVTHAEEILAYGSVIAALFGNSDEGKQVLAYHKLLSEYPLSRFPAFHYYFGSYEDEIVATGVLFVGKETVGIYDIVTKVEQRHKGIGSAMFAYLVNQAQQTNRDYAVLQASPDGMGIYERAGFTAVGKVHTFENRLLLTP